jgi:hypothetical protein
MSIVLEFTIIANSVVLFGILYTQFQLARIKARIKLKKEQEVEHQQNLVTIGGIADVFGLEE